jgi:hypothetical protein
MSVESSRCDACRSIQGSKQDEASRLGIRGPSGELREKEKRQKDPEASGQ